MSVSDDLRAMMARPIAHRGLHGCGRAGPVENTVAAAIAAVEAGYGIECDVLFARDGTPVVFHDATLDRLAGRRDQVSDLDADALAGVVLRDGSTIPTLDTLLAAIAGRVALVIEIKTVADASLADTVLDRVARYAGPVVLESFDPAIVARCRNASCAVGLVGPADEVIDATALPRCDFLSWGLGHLHSLQSALPRTCWTVRSPEEAARAKGIGAQIVFEDWHP